MAAACTTSTCAENFESMITDEASLGHAAGWAVAESTAYAAIGRFGSRLRSVYVLGSLAHGGFCPLVSDVDVAIILTEFGDRDQVQIDALTGVIRKSGARLAERLSLFWGTEDSIAQRAQGGRFPALDRLDLIRHGTLIAGEDIRDVLPEPSYKDLVAGTARFACGMLARPDRRREIVDAEYTAALGPRSGSKVALFPVRFLLTARTGLIGENQTAADHYLAVTPDGPTAELARAGMKWRRQWSRADRKNAARLLASGAVPLYREFAAEYADLLRGMDLARLADELSNCSAALAGS
jgi:hypothetical protein